jgi:hypothetical protein
MQHDGQLRKEGNSQVIEFSALVRRRANISIAQCTGICLWLFNVTLVAITGIGVVHASIDYGHGSLSLSHPDRNGSHDVVDPSAPNPQLVDRLKKAERAMYVRRILSKRIQYVQSGRRLQDFANWAAIAAESNSQALQNHPLQQQHIQHLHQDNSRSLRFDDPTLEIQDKHTSTPSSPLPLSGLTSMQYQSNTVASPTRGGQATGSYTGGSFASSVPYQRSQLESRYSTATVPQQSPYNPALNKSMMPSMSTEAAQSIRDPIRMLENVFAPLTPSTPHIPKYDDPFPKDRMNLQLVVTPYTVPDQFPSHRKPADMLDILPKANVLQLWLRLIRLGIHFAPVTSTVGLALTSQAFRISFWYPWLVNCIGSAGASFTKWGQWAATRSDMFPEALCDQLATLHNAAPSHSWAHTERTLEASLGLSPGTLGDVFDEVDAIPLASGSIAQVYRAKIGGYPVAVKVRHPRVAQIIDMDFRLMSAVAYIFDFIPALSWLHVRDSVEQFSHTMAAQAYLQVEAHHLELLNYNFRRWPQISFPKPYYASSAVIIESFEPGQIVTHLLDMYEDMAEVLEHHDAFTAQNGTVSSGVDVDWRNAATQVSKALGDGDDALSSSIVQAGDVVPLSLAEFLVTNGVSVYLKMLLVDNLSEYNFIMLVIFESCCMYL